MRKISLLQLSKDRLTGRGDAQYLITIGFNIKGIVHERMNFSTVIEKLSYQIKTLIWECQFTECKDVFRSVK
jgi:hypothetical protein